MSADVKKTMESLLQDMHQKIPFKHAAEGYCTFDGFCEGHCDVCPHRLIEFLDVEVNHWESRMKHGFMPSQADIESLANDYKKVYDILNKKGLINTK